MPELRANNNAPKSDATVSNFHTEALTMSEDPRCCGSGTCIIDQQGRCWCGQEWDGQTMCTPAARSEGLGQQTKTPGTSKAGERQEDHATTSAKKS